MGTRGKKKTPTALLSPDSNTAKYCRRYEPKPLPAPPKCPSWLCDKAKTVWRQLVPKMMAAGILTIIDGAGLARFCALFILWREAIEQLRREDRVIAQTNGVRCANPLIKVVTELSRELARLESAYGLTPADRAGLSVSSNAMIGEPEHISRFFRKSTG